MLFVSRLLFTRFFYSMRRMPHFFVWVCALLSSSILWAHPPQDLMVVKFNLKNDALFCEAEVHYSQLYALKKKRGGSVTEKDYPAIIRSFHMNCPVTIDGELVKPTLVKFISPNEKWGGEYLDHHHDEDEILIAKIILSYPLKTPPNKIQVEWRLIPPNKEKLEIPFYIQKDITQTEIFTVTAGKKTFSWVRKLEEK